MSEEYIYYKLAEVIDFLQNRDFSRFIFRDGWTYAEIETDETDEILIEIDAADASAHTIPEKTVTQVLGVLTHLDDCVKQAYEWFKRLDFSDSKWLCRYANTKLSDFELTGIDFEKAGKKPDRPRFLLHKYCIGYTQKKGADGFLLYFNLEIELTFTVKFLCEDMRAYAIETWVR